MTTDNRANEQIVQDRLTMMPENERAYVAAKAVEALRAAGRLAGEPNEAQVEAAAEGMWDRYGDRGMFQHAAEHLRSAFRKDARAALVAAAEVAPVVQQVSDALALVDEVIAIHADRIGTHYEDCYKYHVACLAVEVKHRLGGKEKNDE